MLWFRNKSRDEQKKALEKVESRLVQLEHSLQELIKQGTSYEIVIEELNIHDPSLDNLTFRFDKLDVKEVSGALNLGNNFGVNVHQSKKKSGNSRTDSTSHQAQPAVNISRSKKQTTTSSRQEKQNSTDPTSKYQTEKDPLKGKLDTFAKKAVKKAKMSHSNGHPHPQKVHRTDTSNEDTGDVKITFNPINKADGTP